MYAVHKGGAPCNRPLCRWFLLAVPGAQKERYLQVASKAAAAVLGACALGSSNAGATTCPMAADLDADGRLVEAGETVVFPIITSRQVKRDTGMKAFGGRPAPVSRTCAVRRQSA